MNKIFLLVLLCVYSIHLHAYSDNQTIIDKVQVKQIILSECTNKAINDRYEVYSCNKYNYIYNITHKDVLVNSSCSSINVEVTFSNDSVFIRETEVKTENHSDNKCLRDLSYQIKVDVSFLSKNNVFFVLISDISSKSYQVFYPYNSDFEYPITEKLNYQYKPFIMDGTCEWTINSFYGGDGYKKIISNEDTLILGRTYKKIFDIRCRKPNVKEYAGAIREDNKQVFFIDIQHADGGETKPEKMIYDFNLKAGDKIEYEEGFPFSEFEVLHVDTILMEGIARRKFYFRSAYDTWVEGIGNEYVFTHPFPPLVTGFNPVLAGVRHNEKVLFCGGDKCSCDQLSSVSEHKSIPNFHIVKNPIENKLLVIDFYESEFSKLDIYSFNGVLVISKEIAVENGTLEVPLADLRTGNYIVILSRPDNSRESTKIIVL